MVFSFANGALGTFLLSDAAASPRSWEQTSQENTSYASYPDEDGYHIAGTRGSLSVPTMRVRSSRHPSWWEPFDDVDGAVERSDPLANQVTHFAAVIRGEAEPICSGRDGLTTLKVVDAVVESARTNRPVEVAPYSDASHASKRPRDQQRPMASARSADWSNSARPMMLWPEARRSPQRRYRRRDSDPLRRHPRHRPAGRGFVEAVQEAQAALEREAATAPTSW